MPVYNFAAGATAKNLVEITGDSWENKVVGLAVAAGGANAFMAPMSLAISLMLDFRCIVIPRYVYALSSAFTGDDVTDPDTRRRIDNLADELLRVGRALA
jgi:FMN reductase